MTAPDYQWYRCVEGDEIEQGDILAGCPVVLPSEDLASDRLEEATLDINVLDVIVVSQSCDLVKGREKLDFVLLCCLWKRSDMPAGDHLSTDKGLEDARKGNLPGVHLINSCDIQGFGREVTLVDFRRIYSLPVGFVRRVASNAGQRLRLLPPYREHLSQALARYFMRVGLPVDIPPFK